MPNQVSEQTNRSGKSKSENSGQSKQSTQANPSNEPIQKNQKNQKNAQTDDLNLGDREGTGQRGDTMEAGEYKKDGFGQKTGNVGGQNRSNENESSQTDENKFSKKSGAQWANRAPRKVHSP